MEKKDNHIRNIISELISKPLIETLQNFDEKFFYFLKQKNNHQVYDQNNILFHLYDKKWLKGYIADSLKNRGYKVVNLSESQEQNHDIVDEIFNHTKFQKLLFENKKFIVFATIITLINQEKGTNLDQEWTQDFYQNVQDFDKLFRLRVIYSLNNMNLGFPIGDIEYFLEVFGVIWRKEAMKKTFNKKFSTDLLMKKLENKGSLKREFVSDFIAEHQELWMAQREADYFKAYVEGYKDLELTYLGRKSITPKEQKKLQKYDKIHKFLIKEFVPNKKLTTLKKELLLVTYLKFRKKEITERYQMRKTLNNSIKNSFGYQVELTRRQKARLNNIFYHSKDKWRDYIAGRNYEAFLNNVNSIEIGGDFYKIDTENYEQSILNMMDIVKVHNELSK